MAEIYRKCKIPDCNGNSHYTAKGVRGWCRRHYRLWQAHGEPVARKAADGEPFRYMSETVFGYNGDECLIWPFARTHGYAWVSNPDGGTNQVHRLACEHRYGPPPTSRHEAAHICGGGSRGCVAPNHVRWALPSENQADRVAHGTSNRGERCAQSKLTESQVREIRALEGQLSIGKIAERYGVSVSAVSHINTGSTWFWLAP